MKMGTIGNLKSKPQNEIDIFIRCMYDVANIPKLFYFHQELSFPTVQLVQQVQGLFGVSVPVTGWQSACRVSN